MAYKVKKAEVWAGDMMNRAGMLARVLESLANAGADLEFVIARRVNENTSRCFVAPIKGKKQKAAAAAVGLQPAANMHAIRIEGSDKPGLGARITRDIAAVGINLRGLSAGALGKKSVCYIALETEEEAANAAAAVKKALRGK